MWIGLATMELAGFEKGEVVVQVYGKIGLLNIKLI